MSDESDIVTGSLVVQGDPDQACFEEDIPSLIKSLPDFLGLQIPRSITNVTVGNVQPLAGQENNIWFRRSNSGGFLGIYMYIAGEWTLIFPAEHNLIRIAGGNSNEPPPGTILANSVDSPLTAQEQAAIVATWYHHPTADYYTIFDVLFVGF